MCLHTIHNWSLQPFSQAYDLASHTTHVVCVNFMRECLTVFNVDSERQIVLRNFFIADLFTLRALARNLLRGNRRRNTFLFRFGVWPGSRTPVLRLISQHTNK